MACKLDTFFHQAFPDSHSSCRWLDQQQAQLGHGLRFFHQKDRSDWFAIYFGDPAALKFRVEMLNEVSHDFSDQSFEALVIVVLVPVKHSMTIDHPAHIARPVRAKRIGTVGEWLRSEQALYSVQGINELLSLEWG